jgi:phage terminase large subunit-like protein
MLKHKTHYKTSSTESLLARAHSSTPVVARYCLDVLTGNIPVGRLVFLAVERHVRELAEGEVRGLHYDDAAASYVIEFFEKFLVLAEGEHAGKPFLLSPWQQFTLAMLFGWKTADGFRRFRTAYLEIGKGNGKSPLAAGILLYGLVADGEESAEIYSAAVTKDQAKILFRDAENMRAASPWLRQKIASHRNNLSVVSSASFARPISSEKRGLDGKRVHMALIDEVHEHPSDVVVNKMRAGTKGRRQALILMITNSGFDRETVCYYQHEYSRKVLESVIEGDSHFAYICHLDACEECQANGYTQPKDGCNNCDSWLDQDVWIKANPNLGISIHVKYLNEQIQEAIAMPSKEGIVRRLNLCFWTQGEKRAIGAVAWARCAGEGAEDPIAWRARKMEALRGLVCGAGMDLGSTDDLSSVVYFFPKQKGLAKACVLPYFYAPAESVALRTQRDRIPYELWQKQGFLKVTPGTVRDDDFIRKDINECARLFDIRELRFDPYRALLILNQLQSDGFTVEKDAPLQQLEGHRQGFLSMHDPTTSVLTMIKNAEFEHGNNPVLTWNADNLVVVSDAAGNQKPVKPSNPSSPKKIDGMVAFILAKAATDAHPEVDVPTEVFFV